MFRLFLLLTALAGFGAVVVVPDISPRAMQPADSRAALVYGGGLPPEPVIIQPAHTPFDPATAFGTFISENLGLAADAAPGEDLLTITTEDGEVIRIAAEIPPARIGATLVRIEANDRHAEAQRLATANARARQAVAAAARAATGTNLPADVVYSTGSYVNLRSGPSTGYPAVGFMGYGMAAERLEVLNTGWTHIRIIETGQEGYMSSLYVTTRTP